jgi:hypothetical protein
VKGEKEWGEEEEKGEKLFFCLGDWITNHREECRSREIFRERFITRVNGA